MGTAWYGVHIMVPSLLSLSRSFDQSMSVLRAVALGAMVLALYFSAHTQP